MANTKASHPKKDSAREDRIIMEIVVDAYNADERAVGWHASLENTLNGTTPALEDEVVQQAKVHWGTGALAAPEGGQRIGWSRASSMSGPGARTSNGHPQREGPADRR